MKKLFFFLFVFCLAVGSHAQDTKEEIQKRQQELQKELDDLNSSLIQIRKNKKQSIGQLALVQKKIKLREALVNNISRDLKRLDNDIEAATTEITQLQGQLDTLKQNYAKSLVFAYKNRSNYDYLNFLFSASSFNDAVKRVAYLRSYRQNREIQANNIVKTEELMGQKINSLTSTKTDKGKVLGEQSKQLITLEDDKKQKDIAVEQLKNQEQEIAAQIKTNEKNRLKLKTALQQVIRRAAEEARRKEEQRLQEEAKRKTTANQQAIADNKNNAPKEQPKTDRKNDEAVAGVSTGTKGDRTYSPFESTPEGLTQSLNFETNHGNLPWPVNSGIVTIHFGPYQIPGTGLRGVSDGIYIALPVGATVKAVADGEVSSIFDLGGQSAVVIRHGKYFTTYNNLSTVNVNKGDEVKAGKAVGAAAADDTGEGQLLFMVSNEKGSPLDPEKWLKHR